MTTGDPMRKDQLKAVAFRLTPDLIKRLDRYAAAKTAEGPLPYARVDALRVLLIEGLDRHDAEVSAPEPKKRR